MIRCLCFALVTICLFSCKKDDIKFGHIDSINSKILNEKRQIWIYIPEVARSKNNKKKFPVLYLLDGPSHYYSVTGLIKQLSSSNANTVLPEMIVVAIPNTNRDRDLTPTSVQIDTHTGDTIKYETGGGNKFLDFIEKELMPYMENTYPTAPYNTFIGHSFGGLSVINALISKPYLFNNYIAIDPSLWWDNQYFLDLADSILAVDHFDGRSLYIAIANTMDEGLNIQTVQRDTSYNSEHIRSILKFVQSLETKSHNGLNFKWKYYQNDNHLSVPLIAEYDGLRYLFQWYSFKELNQTISNAKNMTSEELINIPISHFKAVSKHLGYEVHPPEMLINIIGYELLASKMPEKASAFFNLNIRNFPESSNVYYSMGDCYLAQRDTAKALEYFKKAFEINKLDIYKQKIKQLN